MEEDEYLDLVDAEDRVIGRNSRSAIYSEKLTNFRAVAAFLVNAEGKLWIPRRAATKSIFPLCLDMSMGGHVASGETYNEAFKRELAEELNIDADKTPWRFLGRLMPARDKTAAFESVYEIRMDEAPQYNPDEFVEYFWLTPDELLKRIREGDGAKSDLPILVRKFYCA